MRLDAALWRALAVYRAAAWLYAAATFWAGRGTYDRPGLGLAVLAGMGVWTGAAAALWSRPRLRRWPLAVADLALALAALLSSLLVLTDAAIRAGEPTLPVSWVAAPVLAWAVWSGPVGGGLAGAAVGATALLERGEVVQATVNSCVLLLLAGTVVGYVVQLARRAERAQADAVQREAAQAERERLSRQVHDGVRQALALVSRRAEPELAALAAQQEVALRRLVSASAPAPPLGQRELVALLATPPGVELAAPAGPVLLPAQTATELAAAVAAAVDNALRHGGGRAWLLVEDEATSVTVTVRDDGPGVPAGRLEQAEREGRLGVAQSVRGRLRDLGGTVEVVSAPGQGTEVELRVPRVR